ncbi:MAG: hypothetical protein IPM64_12060 [Phycisphaerales bacterium]|nr:hypothetical protein [Phycisphaerales bacterium]
MPKIRFGTALVAGFVASFGCALALGQDEKPWTEPGLTYLETSRPYAQWGLALLFLVACALIGFKNPHRSHLD